MPAERFFTPSPLQNTVELIGQEHQHLTKVMRIKQGETVELVNGKNVLAKAEVVLIEKNKTLLKILSYEKKEISSHTLTLIVPLMRSFKLELVIEKGVELGVSQFLLYQADFSEKKEISEHQKERLFTIAVSAMKQCARLDLPSIEEIEFQKIFGIEKELLFADPKANLTKKRLHGNLAIITGPEKGFSEKERKLLEKNGKGISFHPNVLRAETAPIVAAALYIND